MIAARSCLAILALVACAWFVVGIRQAHDTKAASTLISAGPRVAAAQTSRIENLLSSARTLNPDLTPDVLEARFADLAHRRAQAVRILEDTVRREPMNLTAWADLAVLELRSDPAASVLAARRVKELDPTAR